MDVCHGRRGPCVTGGRERHRIYRELGPEPLRARRRIGRERWRYTTGNDTIIYNQIGIASSAAIANGIVFVGGRDGQFHAVDEPTGALRWKHDNNGGWTIASPAVRNGVVYFPTSDGTRFKALDAATGEVKLNLENKAVSFSSPALAGDVAIYGTSDGYLHAVDLTTAPSRRSSRPTGRRRTARSTPTTRDGCRPAAAVPGPHAGRDDDRDAHDDDAGVGAVVARGVDGVVYFGSTDGQVYAVR